MHKYFGASMCVASCSVFVFIQTKKAKSDYSALVSCAMQDNASLTVFPNATSLARTQLESNSMINDLL